MKKKNQIVVGSLAAVARQNRQSLAETFLSADVIIILDTSGSMSTTDAPGGKSRHQAAKEQLEHLQQNHPGRIALICFADRVEFAPGGHPLLHLGYSTDMVAALRYVKSADDTDVKFILISDGLPNSQEDTLAIAQKFKTPIQTIYIGPENDHEGGRGFLQRLANATGGAACRSDMPGMLAKPVEELLLLDG